MLKASPPLTLRNVLRTPLWHLRISPGEKDAPDLHQATSGLGRPGTSAHGVGRDQQTRTKETSGWSESDPLLTLARPPSCKRLSCNSAVRAVSLDQLVGA